MKKLTTLLLVLAIVMTTVFSGCGAVNTGKSKSSDLKVVLLIPGNLGDKSFYDSANRGLEKIKKEMNAKTKVIEMGTDKTKWEPTLDTVSEQDWDIIISGTSDMTEPLKKAAKKYTKKKYINFDTSQDAKDIPSNLYGMYYKENEVSFLAGAAAALITNSKLPCANSDNKIGFVGGMDNPGINDFLVGYIEGAQYVNKDIKVAVSYVGAFDDPAKGKETALLQYNSKVDVIFQVAGQTGLGVIDAAKDKNAYAIGVDSDQAMIFKSTDVKKSEHIPTSAVKNIDLAILRAVKLSKDNKLNYGKFEVLGLKEQGVGLTKNEYYNKILTDEMKNKMNDIEKKLSSGEIKVGTAFGLSSKEIKDKIEAVRP